MAAYNAEAPDKIYKWIEKKPITEAVLWTNKEKFYLVLSVFQYETDWKKICQTVKNVGEPYRPKEWFSPKNCERQLKLIISNQSREVKAMDIKDMLVHIGENLRIEYVRDVERSTDTYKTKYAHLIGVLNRVKQGNLSRNEVNSLYSQARRTEIEGKQYMEQLSTRQNASLSLENSTIGLMDEPIKWNAPSAPLLTSLLRSHSTIPANRNVTITSPSLQSPISTSRTRSGKLLPLSSSSVRTIQGTPTLSKLLEAPANPYLPSPPLSTQKNNHNEVLVIDTIVGNNTKKDNSPSTPLNKMRMDNVTSSGSFNQINKFNISYSKKLTPRSLISVKNGTKESSNIVNLLSDSDNEDILVSTPKMYSKLTLEDQKDRVIMSRLGPRATRSQTRAEGGFKQLNDSKLSDEKKEQDTLQPQNRGSQINENRLIEEDVIDIDQIEIEPLSSVQREILTSTPKVTRSSIQRSIVPTENVLTNEVNSKEINNQMLNEISTNFILNSSVKSVSKENKNILIGQSRVDNSNNLSGCLIPIESSAVKDSIFLCKDGQSFSNSGNTLSTLDGKLLKQNRLIELKSANIRCIDGRNEKTYLSFANQPFVVVNKLKKPYNIKLASELKDKVDDIQLTNVEAKQNIRIHNSSQNFIKLLDSNSSYTDDVIIIDDDVNVNVDDRTNELSSKADLQNSSKVVTSNDSLNFSGNFKSMDYQLNEKKNKNDKASWNMFGKPQNLVNISSNKSAGQDGVSKIEIHSNVKDSNSRFIKELDFDYDQSTSLSELYNGVEEIVEMHSFDNEDLNSLIVCSSMDSNETEEQQNIIDLDQDDSGSECDSTIGAFDTFAQITRVPQKSSKDIKYVNREPKTVKQDENDLRNSIHINDSDDEQSSAVSVTGIPILQGVLSDVMSKIDSESVAALNVPQVDVVEISSDEDQKQESNLSKLNDVLKTKKLVTNVIKNFYDEYESEIKDHIMNRSDNISPQSFNNINECETNEAIKIVNIPSKDDIKLHDNEKIIETKSVKNNENNLVGKEEIKKVIEIESNITKDQMRTEEGTETINSKEKLSKEVRVKKKKSRIIKRRKHILTIDIEKPIVPRLRSTQEDILRGAEMQRLKALEIKKTREAEINKAKEAEIEKERKARELEVIRLQEAQAIEIQKAKEAELQKLKDVEIKRLEEARLQKAKEAAEKQKAKEAAEEQKAKEAIEKQKAKEAAEKQKAKEAAEKQKAKEAAEKQKAKEAAEKQKAKEAAEKQKAKEAAEKEAEERKIKDEEMKKVKEAEIQRTIKEQLRETNIVIPINTIEEEIKKVKEPKIKITEETVVKKKEDIPEIKELDNSKVMNSSRGSELKKYKMNMKSDYGITDEERAKLNQDIQIILEDPFKNYNKNEISFEKRKVNCNENEIKEYDLKISSTEQETVKSNMNELKKNKDLKIITRTRGLKTEDKLKESSQVSKKDSTKPSSCIKSVGSISSNVISNNTCNSQISNNDLKKQPKNVDSDNITCNKDSNINSSENVSEVGGKTRTRSSSLFKPCKIVETKALTIQKSNEENEVCIVPKTTVGLKTKINTSLTTEVPTTSSNPQHRSDLSKIESSTKSLYDNNYGKQLTVSVVMLNPDDVSAIKERGDNISVKHQATKVTNNEHLTQKTLDVNEKSDKPVPKKRGRKRKIDIQNEQLQQSNSDKLTLQNGTIVITNTSVIHDGPPSKKTKNSLEPNENTTSRPKPTKKVLKLIFKHICENNKYISLLEKENKDMSIESRIIIKEPVELKDIKKKINSGEISRLSQLQVTLLLMSYNAIMTNSTNSIVCNDATSFQAELLENCRILRRTLAENNDNESVQMKKNFRRNKNNVDDSSDADDLYNINIADYEFSDSDSDSEVDYNETDCDNDNDDANDTISINSLLKDLDHSCDSSDTENYFFRQKKKRNKNFSDISSDSDSDIYDPHIII